MWASVVAAARRFGSRARHPGFARSRRLRAKSNRRAFRLCHEPRPRFLPSRRPKRRLSAKDAEKLSFVLLGFDIEGEFDEFVAIRHELAAPLIGRRVTVAEIFDFATKLQAAYVRAGYLLVRVVVTPQELGERARVKTPGHRRVS